MGEQGESKVAWEGGAGAESEVAGVGGVEAATEVAGEGGAGQETIASNIQALRPCRYNTTWQVSTQISGDGNENDNFASIWSATVRACLEFGHLVEVVAWQHHRNYHELANAFPHLVHLSQLSEFSNLFQYKYSTPSPIRERSRFRSRGGRGRRAGSREIAEVAEVEAGELDRR